MKRILIFLIALFVMLFIPLIAYAHDVPQNRDDCSIEIIVRYDGKDVSGGTLTAIKVGYVDEEDGNFFFRQELTDIKLEDLASSSAPTVLKDFYDNNKENYNFYTQTQSVKDGRATFQGLSTGVYLITQENAAEGFSQLGAFLISVPYMEDGKYQYHVTAAIKSEIERKPEPTDPPPTKPTDPELPQTGQLNWPIPLLLVSGLVLFVLGWMLCFSKQRELYEN